MPQANKKPQQDPRLIKFRILEMYEQYSEAAQRMFLDIYNTRTTIVKSRTSINTLVEQMVGSLEENNRALVEILSLVEMGNRFVSHAVKVAMLTILLGRLLDLTEQKVLNLGTAALLHDIGKARTKNNLLAPYFSEAPTDSELWKQHPEIGAAIVSDYLGFGKDIAQMVARHHEQMDGQGFPAGLDEMSLSQLDCVLFTANFIDNVLHKGDYSGMEMITSTLKSAFTTYPDKFDPLLVNLVLSFLEGSGESARDSSRITLTMPATFKFAQDNKNYHCRILDLSPGGARMRTREQLYVDQRLRLSFVLSGVAAFSEAPAQVVRKEEDERGYIYGLQFVDASERTQQRLERALDQYLGRS